MQILTPSTGGLYTGLTNAVSTIYRVEGWRTLWKGVSSVIVGAGVYILESPELKDSILIRDDRSRPRGLLRYI